MATQKATTADKVEAHKCLMYWHARNIHTIPLGKREERRLKVLFPGWNTVDSTDLEQVFAECGDLIESGRLELRGIIRKDDGTIVESSPLSKISAREFTKILSATYNPETLEDLSDPENVPALLTSGAVSRKQKLNDAVGNEADNIEVRGEELRGL